MEENLIQNQNGEINLSEIDWNKLSPEEFRALNQKLIQNQKAAKKLEHKSERISGNVDVILRGKTYNIKMSVFRRLKTLKSEASKQKLIEKIILENKPIEIEEI